MVQVKRAGHLTLTTPDMERQLDYWTQVIGLGLVVREKNRAVLATKVGQEAIVLEQGERPEGVRLAFQVAPGSELKDIGAALAKHGLRNEQRSDITPGIRKAVVFEDLKGTQIELFADCEFAPEDKTYTGVMPLKLGHIAYRTANVKGVTKFYEDVLGFKVSDWRSDFFVFMRCSRDHHTVNFWGDKHTTLHHLAFEVRDWSEIKRACDFFGTRGIKIAWGPIRHIIGHNIAVYHKNPDGITVELFTDLDVMYDEELGYFEPRPWHQDRPQRPKVWGDNTPTNYWGPETAPH
jgi:catechol 2,3-dioxygenase-like lactoylglutathione lyase family enzyme